jgi:serine/threonine-protein kinase PRP4
LLNLAKTNDHPLIICSKQIVATKNTLSYCNYTQDGGTTIAITGGRMKRPHSDGTEDEIDGADLARLLSGEEFVSAEEEARQAEQRRQRRRERLAQIPQAGRDVPVVKPASVATEPEPGTPKKAHSLGADVSDKNLSVGEVKNYESATQERDEAGDLEENEFDMFSLSSPVQKEPSAAPVHSAMLRSSGSSVAAAGSHQDDFDDAEGYYKAAIGEVIELETNFKVRVAGVIGKGVFSTVLKCHVEPGDATANDGSAREVVALKCVRHNESMAKAAMQEIHFLQQLSDAPSGIVKLLRPKKQQPLYYRGHVVMVMAYREYNLRTVLQKFGRGVGLSLTAVRSYFSQLLSALRHLQSKGILHADIKPDNILVSSNFESVQIGDFGSAMSRTEQSSIPTPYLVSRFYRAPEIILGTAPLTHGIDMWSLAVTIAELFTGSVLFRGRSNNEMLRLFQQVLRVVFPNRIIRQHLRESEKHNLPTHFVQQGTTLLFQQQTVDPVTKLSYSKHVHLQQLLDKTPSLSDVLYKAAGKQQGNVGQLADLLHRCMALDPAKRIDIRSALKHEFFQTSHSGEGKRAK